MGVNAVWGLYLLWGLSSHRGVVGWMERFAIRHFGSADTNLILIVGMFGGFIASVIVLVGLVALLGPTKSRPLPAREGAPRPGLTRARAFVIALGILAATVVAELFLMPRSGESGRIIDLDGPPGPDPRDGERVQVIGTPQPRRAVGYQEKTGSTVTHHRFTPIRARRSGDGDAVRFFQEQELEDGQDGTVPVIVNRDGSISDGRVTVTGTAHANALPTLVSDHLSAGQLADTYWVVSDVSDRAFALVIGIVGLCLAVATPLSTAKRFQERR